MTLILDEPAVDEAAGAATDEAAPAPADHSTSTPEPIASALVVGAAAFLATASAGWMFAGVFGGVLPRIAAVGSALIAAGGAVVSYRTRITALVQYAVLALAGVFGVALMAPDMGEASVPSLVRDALRDGGIAHPPVPFDPGWRLLLVLVVALVGVGGAAVAIGSNRPKLAVLVPGPLVFVGALVQPPGSAVITTAVALGLLVGALVVAVGAETGGTGVAGSRYELRRLGRAGAVVGVVLAALVAVSQLGFLFPESTDSQVIPPQRPELPPPAPDRVLFTVESERTVPIRLGTLDVYRDDAFMTPPFDPKRLLDVDDRIMPLPDDFGVRSGELTPFAASPDGAPVEVTIHVAALKGRVLPSPANPVAVPEHDGRVQYDPRTQGLRVPNRLARSGDEYVVHAVPTPTAAALGAAPAPAAPLAEFLDVPAAPLQVRELLAAAPAGANRFERLQFLRNAFYERVVAAGEGKPVDVPPGRVGELLDGKEATPFEITASEVLLARWAGVPARLGYGYYGGDRDGDVLSVRPRNAATWLEAYFEGHGWIPILGTPPRAKASLSESQKNADPSVKPTDELSLIAYAPVKLQSIQLLYEIVRYWFLRGLLAVLLLVSGIALLPGVVKGVRRIRRARWASRHGPAERLAVAYAELRDGLHDLNIGDPAVLPLDFLTHLEPDEEHAELAWLVSRGLWGDLARDLRTEDADAGEELAASVLRRTRRAHSGLMRLLAFTSRASLRRPFTDQVPNLWPRRTLRAVVRDGLRWSAPTRGRRWRPIVPIAAVALVAIAAVSAVGVITGTTPPSVRSATLPEHIAPDRLERFRFVREAAAEAQYDRLGESSLVAKGRVFSVHDADNIQASFQVIALREGYSTRDRDVREGILSSIGAGRFEPTRIAGETVFRLQLPEQRIFLTFPAGGDLVEILVARQGFEDADDVLAALLTFQRTGVAEVPDESSQVRVFDPRRGGVQ
jgi:transglutaminase-like putative cysteine protease